MQTVRDIIKRTRYIPWLIPIILFIAGIFWLTSGGYNAIRDYFRIEPGGVSIVIPPPPADVGIPEGAEPVPVIEDSYTVSERLNPFYEPTRAEEYTKDLLPGTEVYEVEIPGRDPGLIYRTPEGYVYELGNIDVTAYRTPEPFVAAEFRPKVICTTDFSSVGLGVELGFLRIRKAHVGPAAGYRFNSDVWVGIGGGINILKNVDIGGYAGKPIGGEGYIYGLSVGVAIE